MCADLQVDAWGAFVPGRGDLVETLREVVKKDVSDRQLSNLEIREGLLDISKDMIDKWFRAGEPRDYLFFIQNFGKTASAMVALRIAKRGTKDMEISWRLLEGNPAKGIFKIALQGAKIYLGVSVAAAGFFTSLFGFGGSAIPVGMALAGSGIDNLGGTKRESQLTSEQQLDARMLVQTIDYCIMSELEKFGVSSDELRILQASQIEGIGKL